MDKNEDKVTLIYIQTAGTKTALLIDNGSSGMSEFTATHNRPFDHF